MLLSLIYVVYKCNYYMLECSRSGIDACNLKFTSGGLNFGISSLCSFWGEFMTTSAVVTSLVSPIFIFSVKQNQTAEYEAINYATTLWTTNRPTFTLIDSKSQMPKSTLIFFFSYRVIYHNLINSTHTERIKDKKLRCRSENARRFMLLNILLSQSRSFEMTILSRACVSPD